MPTYTMRRTWPDDSDRPDDFVFRADGKDAGRCYLASRPNRGAVWHWTVYGGRVTGDAISLEEAQKEFKRAFETCFSC